MSYLSGQGVCWKISGQKYGHTKLQAISISDINFYVFKLSFCFFTHRYVELKACISRLPENGFGANITAWPDRLHTPPDRLQSIEIDAYIARKELFKVESRYWHDIVSGYVGAFHWKEMGLRNVMDMKAICDGHERKVYRLFDPVKDTRFVVLFA